MLGFLGSGQLARMSSLAAAELGIKTKVYCSESDLSPAEQVAESTVKGRMDDLSSILQFCSECDFVTLENEFIDQKILDEIEEKYPGKLFPSANTFRKIGDKNSEKNTFVQVGLLVAPYRAVTTEQDVLEFSKSHGFPLVLKTAKGGYDGYGNVTLKSIEDVKNKFHLLRGELLIEAFIPYEKELAVLVARNLNGEMVVYPTAHTQQENHICHYVSVPADISFEVDLRIKEMAQTAMLAIDAVGIFAFEFFLTKSQVVYLNESAPRPHNSGHYSIEGCVTSQFHNHIRSVLNLPLGKADLNASHVVMLNLLGRQNGEACLENAQDFLKIKNGHLHLYGKKTSKVGRKMGHFTLLGNDLNQMYATLDKLKKDYML